MIRFSNLVGQAGFYQTGSPNYVDVAAAYTPALDRVTFSAKAADDGWVDGDTIGIRIFKSHDNYKIWYASWDGTAKRLFAVIEEESVGAIANGDAVTVSAVVTGKMMDKAIWEPQFVLVAGATYTLLASDVGKTICFTSASAVTVTVDAALPVGFQCLIVQEGAGVVTLARASTDTLNGQAGNIACPGQFQSLYLYQRIEGAWIVVGA